MLLHIMKNASKICYELEWHTIRLYVVCCQRYFHHLGLFFYGVIISIERLN